jgi:hypothetical protein
VLQSTSNGHTITHTITQSHNHTITQSLNHSIAEFEKTYSNVCSIQNFNAFVKVVMSLLHQIMQLELLITHEENIFILFSKLNTSRMSMA